MTGKDHNRLLGIFHLIQGGLQTFGGLMVGLIYGIMGIIFSANAHRPEEQFMGTMFIVLAFIVVPITLIFAGINLMAGYKMYKEKPGANLGNCGEYPLFAGCSAWNCAWCLWTMVLVWRRGKKISSRNRKSELSESAKCQ